MDNLAHALTACPIGVAIAPKLARNIGPRFFITAMVAVNIPDIDIILALFDENLYHFEHRGFTHSIIGIPVMVLFSIALGFCMMGKRYRQEYGFWNKDIIFTSIGWIIGGHLFLDYLTSYGVQFFWPFSSLRPSFPLMFIIDPLLWVIGLGGAIVLWRNPSRKSSFYIIGLMLALWLGELWSKNRAEAIYRQNNTDHGTLLTWPSPGAPLFWNHLDKPLKKSDAQETLWRQAKVNLWSGAYHPLPIPDEYQLGAICNDQEYSLETRRQFQRFAEWGEHVACKAENRSGIMGCRCIALKFNIAANGSGGFGQYWLPPLGPCGFLPTVYTTRTDDAIKTPQEAN